MKCNLTELEARMRGSLWKTLYSKRGKFHVSPIVVERVDVVKKTWVYGGSKTEHYLLEGRLERSVYSGDVTITFRRFRVPK